jgi:alkylhydroperoxidase family enzyme
LRCCKDRCDRLTRIIWTEQACRAQHAAQAARRGFSEAQIAAVKEPGGTHSEIFTAEERAVLRFTDLLTAYPRQYRAGRPRRPERLLCAGTDRHLVSTIATANWTNRINEGLQTPK